MLAIVLFCLGAGITTTAVFVLCPPAGVAVAGVILMAVGVDLSRA